MRYRGLYVTSYPNNIVGKRLARVNNKYPKWQIPRHRRDCEANSPAVVTHANSFEIKKNMLEYAIKHWLPTNQNPTF